MSQLTDASLVVEVEIFCRRCFSKLRYIVMSVKQHPSAYPSLPHPVARRSAVRCKGHETAYGNTKRLGYPPLGRPRTKSTPHRPPHHPSFGARPKMS